MASQSRVWATATSFFFVFVNAGPITTHPSCDHLVSGSHRELRAIYWPPPRWEGKETLWWASNRVAHLTVMVI